MREVGITAAIMVALAGCSEAPASKDTYHRVSENVVKVMCNSDPEERAQALSRIVELTKDVGDSPEQAVYDEASTYADDGCPNAPSL